MTAAKCTHCKVRWCWDGKLPYVRDARCPRCDRALKRTTYLLKWPSRDAVRTVGGTLRERGDL